MQYDELYKQELCGKARLVGEEGLHVNGKMIATDLMMPTATAAAGKNRAPLEVYDWRRRG